MSREIPVSPRLKDIAFAAGVHISTVSRALNPATAHLLSPDVVQRIRAAADEMGFSINTLAVGLRKRRSFTIGIIVRDLTNTMLPVMFRGIEERLRKDRYTPILGNTYSDPARMRDIVNTFMSRRVDGLILTYAGVADKTVDLVRSRGIPVVLLNRGAGGADECQVVPDMETGIDQAVGHLVSLGHRHIAHLAGPKDSLVATGKAAAFRLAMTKRGLAVPDPAIAATRQVTDKDAAEASRRLMAGFPALTAVVAANDIIALAFIETARAIGRECPSDVSVVGFNDMPFVDRISPRLTTIRIPHHDMGYKAAALLIQQIDDPGARIPGAVFPTELVIRGSTRALVP